MESSNLEGRKRVNMCPRPAPPKSNFLYFVTFMFSFLVLFPHNSHTLDVDRESITEIVLIAAYHPVMFLHPGHTPAHLRALLTKINPDAIGIEKLPQWRLSPEAIETFPQELYAILTWASMKAKPAYGVDWAPKGNVEPVTGANVGQGDASNVEKRWEAFRTSYRGIVTWEAKEAFGESDEDIVSYHKMENLQQCESRMQSEFSPEERADNVVRESGIVQNIISVASMYPGGRIAVVFGAGHTLSLSKRLQGQANIHVTLAGSFLPLSPQEVERGWHQDDAILLLGESLDSWIIPAAPQSRDHRRTRELLDRLSKVYSASSPVSSYYQAKWKLLQEDLEGAKKILSEVEAQDLSFVLPYVPDRRWCWPPLKSFKYKAIFTLATIYDLQDNHSTATSLYRSLLEPESGVDLEPIAWEWASSETRYDLRAYIESLIQTPYRAGPREAFRAIDCQKSIKIK
jgi:hypothetical protein